MTGVKPGSEEEMRKLLFSVAREARPVLLLDNVRGRIASQSLESFITSSIITGRVLGTSRTLTAGKSTLILITGNGCELGPDMKRRTIVVELFLPADRTAPFKNHLDETRLIELRPKLLGSLYGLVRHWADNKMPRPSRSNSNFARWAQIVGGILENAGYSLPY